MNCSSGQKPDGHSNHYCQGHQSHPGSSFKCGSPVEVVSGTLEKLDEMHSIQQTRVSVQKRREVLFQQLDLSGLEGWSDKNQAAAHALLAEYHDIFPLEPEEMGLQT